MEQEIQLNEQECLPTCMADFNPTLNDIIIYQTEDGEIKLDVKMDKETVWLTQAQMSDLFQTDRTAILRHINNIYKSQELESESTCAKIAQVRTEGKRNVTRYIPYYNLDMIISVGYQDIGCFQRTFFCSFRKYNPFVALLRIFFDLFKEIHDIFILNNSYSQSLAQK